MGLFQRSLAGIKKIFLFSVFYESLKRLYIAVSYLFPRIAIVFVSLVLVTYIRKSLKMQPQRDQENVSNYSKVSVQGVKSLWGDCSVFPRLSTQDNDRELFFA